MNAWGIDMTPTKEQLADPKYWDENAPEGATHAAIRDYSKGVTWYRFDIIDGSRHYQYQHGEDKHLGWSSWLPNKTGWDAKYGDPRPTQPQWTGEGLPPVGIECRIVGHKGLAAGTVCRHAVITYQGDGVGCYRNAENNKEYTFSHYDHRFEPIRTKAEIEREGAVNLAMSKKPQSTSDGEDKMLCEFSYCLYDAGLLRKPMSRKEAFERLRHGEAKFSDHGCNLILDALGYKD